MIARAKAMDIFFRLALRKMSGPNREKVTDEWRKLSNEELHDLLLSVGKLTGEWDGKECGMQGGELKYVRSFDGETRREKYRLEKKLGVDGSIILKWIWKNATGGDGLDKSGSGWKK